MEVFRQEFTKIYLIFPIVAYLINMQLIVMQLLEFHGLLGEQTFGVSPCDRSRKILSDTWGIITDGPPGSNYTQDSHCEWLIKANNSKQFITLNFTSMGTECSYDYIFVHDGESFDSSLLASFSGRTKPQSVTAESGAMLILLYSDTNYVLDGFQAEYSITNCPRNCSNHGMCVASSKSGYFHCICRTEGTKDLYGGSDCSVPLCPDDCGVSQGRGTCSFIDNGGESKRRKQARCVCNKGYSGESCSLSDKQAMGNRWHRLSNPTRDPSSPQVAAHSSVYVDGETDSLFVFGGFDLNHFYGQLWAYRFSSSRWDIVDQFSSEEKATELEEDDWIQDTEVSSTHSPIVTHHPLRELTFSVNGNSTVSIRAKERTERDVMDDSSFDVLESRNESLIVHWNESVDGLPEMEMRREEDLRPSPRYGHAMCSYPGGFLLYGGKLSNGSLSDELWFYDVANNKWSLRARKSKVHPPPLTRHTLTLGADGWVYLFGGSTVPWGGENGLGERLRGLGAPGEFSSSLFRIRLSHFFKQNLRKGNVVEKTPRKNAGDALKVSKDEYVDNEKPRNESEEADVNWKFSRASSQLGDASDQIEDDEELRRIEEEDDLEGESWEEMHPRGGKVLDVRVAAHSTSYYALSNSLLVFGGVVAGGTARFSRLSDRLFGYQLDEGHWSELRGHPAQRPVLRDPYVPGERAFHTANIVGNYLVIFGGYSHRHNKEEICYDNQIYFYHLGCHAWVSHDILPTVENEWHYPKLQGVFAHSADVRLGNQLLVFGGYHGNINGDLLAYVLPPSIAPLSNLPAETFCFNHKKMVECTSDPECGWCSTDEICYGRTSTANCTTNLQTTRCPGVCPALGDCHSCLIHGNLARTEEDLSSKLDISQIPFSVAQKLQLGQCTWCVQNARCHHKNDNFGVCGSQEDVLAGGDVPVGWWGPQGTEVLKVEQCRILDHRPGLTFLKYKHPADYSHPDYVGIINATTADFNLPGAFGTRTELPLVGEVRARLLGYIWPPQISSIQPFPAPWSSAPRGASIRICASYSSAVLAVARPQTVPPRLELVANLTAELPNCTLAKWLQSSGNPVILTRSEQPERQRGMADDLPFLRNERHLVDFEARKTARGSGPYAAHHLSKMELLYNYTMDDNTKVFTFEYLEPYSNGSCSLYLNCLHCLSDSLCGWCETIGKCMLRSVNESEECVYPFAQPDEKGQKPWRYLTLLPSSCPNCSNFVSCETCTSAGDICEWWTEDARCARRGRSPDAVVSVQECPSPCHHRKSCNECLWEAGRCVWCEATQECFSFSVYTSEYQFGLCRVWIDQDYNYLRQPSSSLLQPPSVPRLPPTLPRHHRLGGIIVSHTPWSKDRSDDTNSEPNPSPVVEQCQSCEQYMNCSSCLRSLGCGWCYAKSDPMIGVCFKGDFSKPRLGSCTLMLATSPAARKRIQSNKREASILLNTNSRPRANSFLNKVKFQPNASKLVFNPDNKVIVSDNLSREQEHSASSSTSTLGPHLTSEDSFTFSATSTDEKTGNEDRKENNVSNKMNKSIRSTVLDARSSGHSVIEEEKSVSIEEEEWLWAYSECPDIDECSLNRHLCHPDADCLNTHGSYICHCHRGYVGNGITTCNRTCYEECKNGICSGEPDFQCKCTLGWTGADCGTDCGCHNHSTCDGSTRPTTAAVPGVEIKTGPGHCDRCQELSQGKYCEECRQGSFGNPKMGIGCQLCRCNGHGDEERGSCDRSNGTCFCTGNTRGEFCDVCEEGYYGDPRNSGTCYSECGPRMVLSGIMSGGIGSGTILQSILGQNMQHSVKLSSAYVDGTQRFNQSGRILPRNLALPKDCLWIIDPHGRLLKKDVNERTDQPNPVIIQLMLAEGSVSGIKCGEGSVHVYEGLPPFFTFVSSTASSSSSSSGSPSGSPSWSPYGHSLGTFCDIDNSEPLTIESKSGIMTVFYQKRSQIYSTTEVVVNEKFDKGEENFNATFKVLSCPKNCPQKRNCTKNSDGLWGYCICPTGWTGPNCEQKLCESGLCQTVMSDEERNSGRHYPYLESLFDTSVLPNSLEHLRRILPRFGHSLVADRHGLLWIFGGYSISHGFLNDIRMFDTKNNTWIQVTVDSTGEASMPQGRYFHAAASVHSRREVFIFGGLASGGEVLDDLWVFGVKNHRWMKLETNFGPPPLAGHSLTFRRSSGHYSGGIGGSSSLRKASGEGETRAQAEDGEEEEDGHHGTERDDTPGEGSLVLIGGFGPKEGFLLSCWEYHLRWGTWRRLNTTGNPPTGIYGHSTVYHAPSESFYVYGGYAYSRNHTYISDKLYALHYPSGFWSLLPPFEEYNPPGYFLPRARFLHTAVTTNEYMVVLGGRTQPHNVTSSGIDAYVYSCNLWVRLVIRDVDVSPRSFGQSLGQTATLLPQSSRLAARRAQGDDNDVHVHVVEGFEEGGTRAKVTQMTLPKDLCSLWQGEGRDMCRGMLGCSYCGAISNSPSGNSLRTNISACYTSSQPLPNVCQIVGHTISTNNGATCDQDWLDLRSCEQFTTCSECLARWPSHPGGKQVCQWCSNCPRGHCIRRGLSCNEGPASNHSPGGVVSANRGGSVAGGGKGCGVRQSAVTDVSLCPGYSCHASDCDHCVRMQGCIWTRQVLVTSELGLKVSAEPVYEWSCVRDDVLERSSIRLVSSSPPAPCPPRCSSHRTCTECLSAPGGGEGGWRECRWIPLLGQCVSPSYQALYCAGGVCGIVLHGSPSQCPSPCSSFEQCATCLQDPRCGWCAVESEDEKSGDGVCTEGSLEGPSPLLPVSNSHRSACVALYARANSNETLVNSFGIELEDNSSVDLGRNFSWHYLFCPPEDECQNGHHSCHPEAELCVNLLIGFNCICGEGYRDDERLGCVPVCNPACVHGTCAKPNLCQCNFGYVGQDCSLKCQCNEHSDCKGPEMLNECIQCYNNTMGSQCEHCRPKFVGDPTNGGQCIPCLDYCNGHTPDCISMSDGSLEPYQFMKKHFEVDDSLLLKWTNSIVSPNGLSTGRTMAVCIGCANGTAGEKCETCLQGYFRGSTDHRQACRLCECHGHGDVCDPVTGEHCNCQNNTESDPQCLSGATNALAMVGHLPLPLSAQPLDGHVSKASRHGSTNTVVHQEKNGLPMNSQQIQSHQTQCWKLQCSKCREYYVGSPTNGHQCYRQMVVDSEYCFDPKTQEDCSGKPHPLLPGRTSFLVVQPRFMNVDIRLTVDVTQGGMDLFLSPREDAFIIQTNSSTGDHMVELDPRFEVRLDDSEEDDGDILEGKESRNVEEENAPSSNAAKASSKVYLQRGNSVAGPISLLPHFKVIEKQASGLVTYITLKEPYFVLVVRNLRNRLVLTLPQAAHDLGSTRFHIALLGRGAIEDEEEDIDEEEDNLGWKPGRSGWEQQSKSRRSINRRNPSAQITTFGIAFFRQDQLHIDLFVFFSVFFSCFFLFLAGVVVAWRAKRAADARRARRQHVVQMLHLAQRPFASVSLFLDTVSLGEDEDQSIPHSSEEEMEEEEARDVNDAHVVRCRKRGQRRWGATTDRLLHAEQMGDSSKHTLPTLTPISVTSAAGGGGEVDATSISDSQCYKKQCSNSDWALSRKSKHDAGIVQRGIRPIAVEPTEDGVAGVATVFVKLPGGSQAPVRMALASSLILLSRIYPVNGRAFLRRRSSAHHHHHHQHQGAI